MNFVTLIRSLFCFLIALIIASCGPSESPTVDDSVSWPEINRFDDLAFRADGYARVSDFSAIREMKKDLLDAGKAVTVDTIPTNVIFNKSN